jgi:hypothetical protein
VSVTFDWKSVTRVVIAVDIEGQATVEQREFQPDLVIAVLLGPHQRGVERRVVEIVERQARHVDPARFGAAREAGIAEHTVGHFIGDIGAAGQRAAVHFGAVGLAAQDAQPGVDQRGVGGRRPAEDEGVVISDLVLIGIAQPAGNRQAGEWPPVDLAERGSPSPFPSLCDGPLPSPTGGEGLKNGAGRSHPASA